MARSIWSLGLRTRHLIAMILGISYSVNSLVRYSIVHGRIDRNSSGDASSRNSNKLTEEEFKQLTRLYFVAAGIGRILVAFVILRINNKYLLLGFTIAEVVLSFLSRPVYDGYGAQGLSYVYLTLTVAQQCQAPLALNILSRWSSMSQMTLSFSLFHASRLFIRSITIRILDRLLAQGYSPVFSRIYLGTTVKSIFFVLWFLLGAADPNASLIASEFEKQEIRKCFQRLKIKWSTCPPWRQILKMPELYAFIIGEIGNYWCQEIESSRMMDPIIIPKYRSSVPVLAGYYTFLAASLVNAAIVDFLIKIEFSTINNIRKTVSTVTAWGCAICLLLYGYNLNSNQEGVWIGIFFVFKIANFFNQQALNVHSVSPTYCGFIFSLISGVAFFSMIFLPQIQSFFLSRGQKNNFMYLIGFLLYFANMLMIMIGDLDVKDFNSYGTVKWKDESIVSYP